MAPSPLPVLIGALVLDRAIGEPPLWAHPVMAIGWIADQVEMHIMRPGDPVRAPIVRGGLGWVVGLGACTGVGWVIRACPWPVQAVALWTLFSHRMLVDEVAKVETELADSLDAGRAQVAMLVSRPTAELDASQVRAAAIESLAENLSDSVTAPLLWWAVGGMPGVAAYRWMNTADARFGYRDERWEYLGKVAAHMDDLANLIPARITGLALARTPELIRKAMPEVRKTASPNAGWPMGAMAQYLGTKLQKVGVYTLNPEGRAPQAGDIPKAIRRVNSTHLIIAGLAAGVAAGVAMLGRRPWR